MSKKSEPIYVFESIAQSVLDHGIDTMFGLVGDANLFMVDAYLKANPKATYVPVAIEGSAVLAALAYTQTQRDPENIGIASITHGPALTNAVTALVEGARGRIPMVLLAGDTDINNPRNLQNIDQAAVVLPTGAGFEQLRSPQTASEDIARAIYRAKTEKRPIVANMPANYMWEKTLHETHVLKNFPDTSQIAPNAELDELTAVIASAKTPIVLAGRGAIDARNELVALAETIQAPLATTLKAKGLFNNEPYNLGIFGGLSSPAAHETIEKSDCVICFGTSLHPFTTGRTTLLENKTVIQINTEITEISKNFHPDYALISDAALTATELTRQLKTHTAAPSGFTETLEAHTLTKYAQTTPQSTPGYVNYSHTLELLENALPKDRILTTDGGRFMTDAWCRISSPDPYSFIATANFGSIGLGMQAAIGAAASDPSRPVVLFTGDGGFMMGGLNELNTAVRMKQDLIVIMCNDNAYGAEHIQFLDKEMDPTLSEFNWPSFAEIANALGCHGVTVDSEQSLNKALEMIKTRDGSKVLLIELILDANNVPRMRT